MSEYFGYFARIIVPFAVAYLATGNVSINDVKEYSSTFVVIFTILTGLVAQVMVLVVSALPEKENDPVRIDMLEKNVRELQEELNIQFHLSVFCIALISLSSVFANKAESSPMIGEIYILIIAGLVTHVLMRSLLLPRIIAGLQRLKIVSLRRASVELNGPEIAKPEQRYRKAG